MKFVDLKSINLDRLVAFLNENDIRAHLIKHALYDTQTAQEWVNSKLALDALEGCYVRAIEVDGSLAGWCGIQPDDSVYEIAIVLQKSCWGMGIPVFRQLLEIAKKMGHKEVVLNLLDSRPQYESLRRLASKVETRHIHGGCFTTYHILL